MQLEGEHDMNVNVIVTNSGGLYSDAVMKAVSACEEQHRIQLLFGSMSRRTEPGYNFGGDVADFYNLTQDQATTIRDALLANGVPEEHITIRQ
jgi:hypothetical protein